MACHLSSRMYDCQDGHNAFHAYICIYIFVCVCLFMQLESYRPHTLRTQQSWSTETHFKRISAGNVHKSVNVYVYFRMCTILGRLGPCQAAATRPALGHSCVRPFMSITQSHLNSHLIYERFVLMSALLFLLPFCCIKGNSQLVSRKINTKNKKQRKF